MIFYTSALALGLIVGAQSALFLWSLHYFSTWHKDHLWMIVFAPVLAMLIYGFEQRWPQFQAQLSRLEEQWQKPRTAFHANFWRGFFHLVLSAVSQIFGISTGRESAALIFGADSTAVIHKTFGHRRELLACALAAGFGGIFGSPWAGALFALERFIRYKEMPLKHLPALLLCSWLSHGVVLLTQYHHQIYDPIAPLGLTWISTFRFFEIAAAMASAALLYWTYTTIKMHLLGWTNRSMSWLRKLLLAVTLTSVCLVFSESKLRGLGVELIDTSAKQHQAWQIPILKSVLTAISQASGFRGGEVTPLLSIGASWGSATASWFAWPRNLGVTLGMLVFFILFLKAPWTSVVFAFEVFGWTSWPLALSLAAIYQLAALVKIKS